MSFFPQVHPATSPSLKRNTVAHRLLPFSIQPQRAPHIGTTHWHDFLQLWYSFSGPYTLTVDGKKIPQVPGQLTILPPYRVHAFDSSEADPKALRHICVSLFDGLAENNIAPLFSVSHNKAIFDNKILPDSYTFTGAEKERADEIFSALHNEFSKHHEMNRASIYKNIVDVLLLLAEHSDSVMESSQVSREFEQMKLINSATDFIAKNYRNDISIETVSSHVLMSQSSFSNKFKHTTGQTFLSYCKKTKISRAMWFLRLSSKTLSEIADECGFYDSTHLSHTVKSAFGVSPLTLREQMLQQNRTYGLARHLECMQRLRWMNVMSEDEIAYFRRCAVGMPD